jgi:3-oxoacid CoA-transferase
MAKNAKLTIVEAEHIVPVGALQPSEIHLPGIYVDRIVQTTAPKEIEFTTLAQEAESGAGSEGAVDPAKAAARDQRHRVARRAAKEIQDGFHVNLVSLARFVIPGCCVADEES